MLIEKSRLHSEVWLNHPLAKIFDFFSQASNLEQLTPPWLAFRVVGMSTPAIQTGTLIDYRLKIHGMPVTWQSRITNWQPGIEFSDEQTHGPYRRWHHRHQFIAENGGTRMIDTVDFQVPFGSLGDWLVGSWVRRDLEKIFAYRTQVIHDLFR